MKLIRDRLMGRDTMRTRPATDAELRLLFNQKLQEELDEYWESVDVGDSVELMQEELADLLEVVHSLIRNQGFSPKLISGIATRKRKERGDLARALVWLEDDEEV